MHTAKTSALSAAAIIALLGMSACSDPGAEVPGAGQGTADTNASQPVDVPNVGTVEVPVPAGGAAARIGDVEETISKVACTVLNGQWTMSGGEDDGAKVGVTATEDRATVQTASVVLSNGTVASMRSGDSGSATISWDGETFTVSGTGAVMDLNDPDAGSESAEQPAEADFVITATCQG